jgi:hypothetical protein
MRTFPVSSVESPNGIMPTADREARLRSILHAPVEQLSPPGKEPLVICDGAHALVSAARTAFYDHYPLVLTPDAVWFCLAQGFAHHVSLNAERLRQRFVRSSTKTKLLVERPDFYLGRENPWPEVFAGFSQQIASHVGKLRDLVVADFSTTGPVERAASEVLLMDAFQPYFQYECAIGCGIPSITLLGTPDDWRSVRRRAAMLGEFELGWWIDALLPVLDQIVATAEGSVERAFWQSFFRHESRSGIDELTGWIQLLFPYTVQDAVVGACDPLATDPGPERGIDEVTGLPIYLDQVLLSILKGETSVQEAARRHGLEVAELEGLLPNQSLQPNPHMVAWAAGFREAEAREKGAWVSWDALRGPALTSIPSGIASAPIQVHVRDQSPRSLRFVAGLFGVAQDPTSGALHPEFGWAIVHEPSAI